MEEHQSLLVSQKLKDKQQFGGKDQPGLGMFFGLESTLHAMPASVVHFRVHVS